MRRLRWEGSGRPVPRRPYLGTIVLYAVLAAVIVVVAAATGGGIVRAVAVAAAFFVLATAYSWWRWRARMRAEERKP